MKIKYTLGTFFSWCMVSMTCLALLSACENEEVLDTAQLGSSKINLVAFGPSPALRGSEIRFLGDNMDKVTAVIFPGGIEVTDFTKREKGDIRVIIPQEAGPGILTLKTPQGNIETKAKLTYEEPISISKVTSAQLTAGDKLTIEGDYLNLIAFVKFSNDSIVAQKDFISQTRYKIELTVPLTAKSGELVLSTAAAIPIEVYSGDKKVTITEPTITAISPTTIKAGNSITLAGTDFFLVEKVWFVPNIEVTKFTVSADKKSITVAVPANAQDGAVSVQSYSGTIVEGGVLTLSLPTVELANTQIRNGSEITITGTDLDLVTAIWFDTEQAQFTYNNATSLTVTVPKTSASDHINFVTSSTKEVSLSGITYVLPAFAAMPFNPTTIMAGGGNIVITGTNFDLVSKVLFSTETGGTVEAVIDSVAMVPTPTQMSVQVPGSAFKGKVTFVAINGMKVESTPDLDVLESDIPVINSIPEKARPDNMIVIEGKNLHFVESLYFGDVKATKYGAREPNKIEVYIPNEAPRGLTTVKLITFNGKVATTSIIVSGADPILPTDLMLYDFEDGLANSNRWSGVGQESIEDGNKFYEITADTYNTGYWWIGENSFKHPSVDKDLYDLKVDIRLKKDIPYNGWGYLAIMLHGVDVSILTYILSADGTTMTTGGEWKTISIPLSAWAALPNPTPVGGDGATSWGIETWDTQYNWTGFCIDNIRYSLKQ